jgi:hypothetical protein
MTKSVLLLGRNAAVVFVVTERQNLHPLRRSDRIIHSATQKSKKKKKPNCRRQGWVGGEGRISVRASRAVRRSMINYSVQALFRTN